MKEQNTIQKEVSRILQSQTSHIVSQLKYYNSYQSKIEDQLATKTAQITQLQNYLRDQISNIQRIAEDNNRTKKELQLLKKTLQLKNQQVQKSQRQIQELSEMNKGASGIIKRLQQRVQELEAQNSFLKSGVQVDESTQTQNKKEDTGYATNNLLNKIASLQQFVMQLKFEKSQLQQKLKSYDQNQSVDSIMQNDSEISLEQRKLTTSTVLSMIAENQLKEMRFNGEIIYGQKEGKGACQYQEGISYQGEFHQGKRHGFGVITVNDNIIYRGQWRNNLIEGKGRISMIEGEIESYEGHFAQGRFEGYGSMKLKSGKRIIALWKEGKIIGNCIESLDKSKRYLKPQLIQCY